MYALLWTLTSAFIVDTDSVKDNCPAGINKQSFFILLNPYPRRDFQTQAALLQPPLPFATHSTMLGALLRRNMSQKLSVLLLVFGLAWGLMLLRYTVQQPRHQSSAELREQILELSRRYVKVLTEENQNAPGGPQGTSMAGYADLKRTIAVLLDDILTRLVKLEGKIELVANTSSTNTSHPAGGVLASDPAAVQKSSKQETPGNNPGTSRLHPHVPNRPLQPQGV